ncbi:EAA1 protein, partial [Emberiza fucata]|nr:EAA1 protein [Emberiza fucata]
MTKGNGEDPKPGSRMERIQQGVRKRTLLAKKKVQSITKDDVKSYLMRNAFVLFTVVAVILGVILGFSLRSYKMSYREVKYFSFPGELLMRMLQMLVLPLIVSSLVTGIAALDSKASGKMGVRAVVYYMSTTIIAVLIGIIIVVIIHPGKGTKENMHREGKIVQVTAADAFLDLIRYGYDIAPFLCSQYMNLRKNYEYFASKILPRKNTSSWRPKEIISSQNFRISVILPSPSHIISVWTSVLSSETFQPTMSGLFCLISFISESCKGTRISRITVYAPLGILFLIAGKIVEMEDMGVIGGQLAMYTVTVIIGLLIHAVIVLPLLYFVITRKNPWVFIGGLIQALVTALGTSSRATCSAFLLTCLSLWREFFQWVGTCNCNGFFWPLASSWEFITNKIMFQGFWIEVYITATAASIGAAGIPQAGLVTMVIVLTSVGLPTDDITLIIAVDWFL